MIKNLSRKSCALLLLVTLLLLTLAVPVLAAPPDTSDRYRGYSYGISDKQLEEATNTSKDADGNYTIPVCDTATQITVLVSGYGSNSSVWSNNYETLLEGGVTQEKRLSLAYNSKSLIEKLRAESGAKVYYAHCTSEYEPDVRAENDVTLSEGALISHSFILYEMEPICTDPTCDSCLIEHELDPYFDYNTEATNMRVVTELTDTSEHIIILFDPITNTGTNLRVYEELNYVLDKIVYDVRVNNGGVLPRVNLVSHSRGSTTVLQYALDHPWLVDSLVTIGGVYDGSEFGSIELFLNIVGLSGYEINADFSVGIRDIMDEELNASYMKRWNDNYALYEHINFHAIGAYSDLDFVINLFLEDEAFISQDYIEAIPGTARLTNLVGIALDFLANKTPFDDLILNDTFLKTLSALLGDNDISETVAYLAKLVDHQDGEYVVLDDCFVHLDSQIAVGYKGVNSFSRKFDGNVDDYDLTMLATSNVAIPHNLEPGDAQIHDYILSVMDTDPQTTSDVAVARISIGVFSGIRITYCTAPAQREE